MSQHSLLSPSAAHRWMNCPGCTRLEEGIESETSPAAEEGTLAHKVAEIKLRKAIYQSSEEELPESYPDDMDRYTDGYVAYIQELITAHKDVQVLIEKQLDLTSYIPEGFGTCDAIIVGDGVLHVVDFKYGQGVLVDAKENPQMMIYAVGALELFDMIYEIDEIQMTIYQPRRDNITSFSITKQELLDWAENHLKPVSLDSFAGTGGLFAGPWCRFCKVRSTCEVRAKQSLSLAQLEFRDPALLSDEEIEEVLSKIDELVTWAGDVQKYALQKAMNEGKKWAGFKLVESRSNRKYADEKQVAQAAIAAGFTDIYKQTVIGVTDMERYMGKKAFKEVLGDLVIKPKGKTVLVAETDSRPEITGAVNEFVKEN